MRALEESGIPIAEGSRLTYFKQSLFDLANSNGESDARILSDWLFASIEADEIIAVADVIQQYHDSDAIEKAKILPKGAQQRGLKDNQLARNTQFELFIWGLLKRSGLPVKFGAPDRGEADLIATCMGLSIQIEVKRVINKNNFSSLLRKTKKNFSEDLPGVVCLSIDHAAFGHNGIIALETGDTLYDGQKYHNKLVSEFYRSESEAFDHRLGLNGMCIGAMVLSRVPMISGRAGNMSVSNVHRALHMHDIGSSYRYGFEFLLGHLEKVWGKFPATS